MDYMLLKSGEVMTFDYEYQSQDMPTLLKKYDGVAYFYLNPRHNRYHKKAGDSVFDGCTPVKTEDVPDIIKLAAMLE